MAGKPFHVAIALLAALAARAEVTFLPVESVQAFPDAAAPDALRYACAPSSGELEALFRQRGLRFDPGLRVSTKEHAACHIYYEPTVQGYRASPESRPIQGLYVAVDPLSFVVRTEPNGDSLSIAKQALPLIDRPLDVTLSIPGGFDPALWPGALAFHFSESKHRFQMRKSGSSSSHPWAQDHQKAGEADGQLRILVPRRIFEGRRDDGETFGPMLDRLDDPIFTRSKLSWEGGDIQFATDPRRPERLILMHGGVGRYYWGLGLTPAEASYVLMAEFGADMAVDLTATSVHADYAAMALPKGGVVLVSRSMSADPNLFLAAAGVIERLFGARPTPAWLDFRRFLETWDKDLAASAGPLRGLIRGVARSLASYEYPEDAALEKSLTAYVDAHCSGDPTSCFGGPGKNAMLENAPDLLRRSSNQSGAIALFDLAAERMLGVMEAQLPRDASPRELALDAVAETFEKLGFRVIRVPYLYAPKLHDVWPGVAYVNSLVDGDRIFMPALGLGRLETEMFADIQQKLGADYQVIPVNAWASVLGNGGVHCVFGVVREPIGGVGTH
ncbi:MAG: hypothetical protein H6509_03400 [Bryobacterales bacterium]|nr:hypothetical protein [Bryobacterales bacterium]